MNSPNRSASFFAIGEAFQLDSRTRKFNTTSAKQKLGVFMKKKAIILTCVSVVSGLALGGVLGWYIGKSSKTPTKVEETFTSSVSLNNDETKGKVTFSALQGNVGEEITFSISILNTDYEIDYVTINGQSYLPNSDNYFSFDLLEGENSIATVYREYCYPDSSSLVRVYVDEGISHGTVALASEGSYFSLNSYVELSVTPESGYYAESLTVNGEYLLCPTKKGNYSFRTMGAAKEYSSLVDVVSATFLAEGTVVDHAYTDFLEIESQTEISAIDLTAEEYSSFSVADLLRIALYRVEGLDSYMVVNYNEARSKALGIVDNTQGTNTAFIKENGANLKEVISYSSNAQTAQRNFRESDEKAISTYLCYGQDRVKSSFEATFDNYSSLKEYEDEESFEEDFFIGAFDLINYSVYDTYLLDEATSIGEGDDALNFVNGLKKTENGYTLTLNLSPKAVYALAQYMVTTTSYEGAAAILEQSEKPNFHALGVRMELDSSFYPLNYVTRESYDVQTVYAGSIPTTAYGKSTFYYGEEAYPIPALSENVDYQALGTYGKVA